MVVAIVAIVALPGPFPAWMKIDQVVCGLILLGVNVLVNGAHMRARFASRSLRRHREDRDPQPHGSGAGRG